MTTFNPRASAGRKLAAANASKSDQPVSRSAVEEGSGAGTVESSPKANKDSPVGSFRGRAGHKDVSSGVVAARDLAHKKIFPALQAMIRRGNLHCPVIGVAKAGWTIDQLKDRARDSLTRYGGGVDEAAFSKLEWLLRYIDGDYRDSKTFHELRKVLGDSARPLHYLAIPPSTFSTVVEGLEKSGCAKDARVVLEKP